MHLKTRKWVALLLWAILAGATILSVTVIAKLLAVRPELVIQFKEFREEEAGRLAVFVMTNPASAPVYYNSYDGILVSIPPDTPIIKGAKVLSAPSSFNSVRVSQRRGNPVEFAIQMTDLGGSAITTPFRVGHDYQYDRHPLRRSLPDQWVPQRFKGAVQKTAWSETVIPP
jgi:hypothetical protein